MGRTGAWFGHQIDGVTPDVMTLAKGLGGGVPIGAVAVTEKAAAGLSAVAPAAVPHASTFGGNPLAAAAANAVFDIIEKDKLLDNVNAMGEYLGQRLGKLVEKYPGHVTEARGRGLLRGIAVSGPPAQVTTKAREKGCLLSIAGANVIRFAPPYIVTKAQLDEAVGILDAVLAEGAGK
jgi:acetylornithine/N-succinyldiaminopimelate aminotransferase